MIRLGLFPVSRLHPPVIDVLRWYVATAGLIVAAWLLKRQVADSRDPRRLAQPTGLAFFVAVCVGSLVAMPLTSVLLGQAIELYHYRDSFTRYFSLAALVAGLHACEAVWRHARSRSRSIEVPADSQVRAAVGMGWAVIVPAAVLCCVFVWRFATSNPTRSDHMRSDFSEWAALGDYRRPFVELARELSNKRYDNDLVLGTFDHQVWSWWVTFKGGYSYLADACTTNAKDVELERRAAQLARLIGMSRADFVTFARRDYVMIFWMSCSKYQGTQAYSFAPLDDYSEPDRHKISSTPGYLNFTVALPLTQQARLGSLFETIDLRELNRLDLVVLTKDESVGQFAPPDSEFSLTFENRLFRLWRRRTPAGSRETRP